MKSYQVVWGMSNTVEDAFATLVKKVEGLMGTGWKPQGSVSEINMSYPCFMQAMIK
ncbi:MAG: hypothetical protein QF856_04615 [Candidatus Marinimicrobia bacterium]|jgi:hypothetical protein|nr:hypothetical protein [Candidatus Neomarinimicrobiota bacterium]